MFAAQFAAGAWLASKLPQIEAWLAKRGVGVPVAPRHVGAWTEPQHAAD